MNRTEIISANPISAYLRSRGVSLEPKAGEQVCLCPFHDDHNPSLRVNDTKGVYFCDVCQAKGTVIDLVMHYEGVTVGKAMGILGGEMPEVVKKPVAAPKEKPKLKSVARYVYRNEVGDEMYQVIRYEPKTFKQARKTVEGWKWGMEGVTRLLYNLPEVLKAAKVYICEGEKDCDTLIAAGLATTTNVGGAGKWLAAYSTNLAGKEIVICPDNDDPGKKHADRVLDSVAEIAAWVKVLKIPAPHKDITDYLVAGGKLNDLEEAVPKLYRGLHLPIYSMAEAEKAYKKLVDRGDEGALRLEKWLPSLKWYRRLIPGELMVIIADTGGAKTAALQNIARVARPLTVLMFELELPIELMFERQAAIDRNYLGCEIEKAYRLGDNVDGKGINHIWICPQAKMNLETLEKMIVNSELVIGQKPDIVMLDYIQLMSGAGSRYERISDVADGLKTLAKSTNTIMIIASQIHRPENGSVAKPGLHSAKDSGNIENAAGLVLGLSWPENEENTIYAKVLKCTKGKVGYEIICNFENSLRITEREATIDYIQS
jgi:hypothetical protein